MGITKGLIVTGVVGGTLIAFRQPILAFIGKGIKAKNIPDNIQIKIKGGRVVGFNQVDGKITSDLLVVITAHIYNQSGFDLSLKNVVIQWDKKVGSDWENVGISNGFTEINSKNGQLQSIDFPLVLPPKDVAAVLAKSSTVCRVITKWDIAGLPMSYTTIFKIGEYFDLKQVTDVLKNVVSVLADIFKKKPKKPVSGLGEIDISKLIAA